MSETNGGPAFPSPLEWREVEEAGGRRGVYDNGHDGMALRDYFAARALVAIMGRLEIEGAAKFGPAWRENFAADAYRWADAMLAARVKP